jgi:hypothetical protein
MTDTTGQRRPSGLATVERLHDFDTIIDTRSPAEFALDHVPGAINCPALDDAQRAEIGTLYKQVSPFVAKRRGAALVALNIGRHLLERFQEIGARLAAADLLLARRTAQRRFRHRAPPDRLGRPPARGRLQELSAQRARPARQPAGTFRFPRIDRTDRQRQEWRAGKTGGTWRTGARSGSTGIAQGFGAGRTARAAATAATTV